MTIRPESLTAATETGRITPSRGCAIAATPTTAHTITAFGMPAMLSPVAITRIARDDASCGENPPVCTIISPCATAFTASVTTIDGMRR